MSVAPVCPTVFLLMNTTFNMENLFVRGNLHELTRMKTVLPVIFLVVLSIASTLALAAGPDNDGYHYSNVNPFVHTLLPDAADQGHIVLPLSPAETAGMMTPPQLLAPCDVTADTIRVTMNPAGIPPDAAGREWTPYTVYNLPGNPYANAAPSNTDNPGTPNSNGTSSAALYLRGLFDQTLDMHFPVPNGNYNVVLHYSDNASSVGARVFDVTLENTKVEDDFDVFATAGGQYVALARSYPVTVNGNDLRILLVSETVNAIIQGIEIIPLSSAVLTKSVDLDVDVTGCYFAGSESRATVQARVNWNNAVPGDVVNISLGGVTRTIRPGMITVAYAGGFSGKQVIVAPQDISFEVPADGATGTITANFNGDVTCETTINFTAPAACEPTICAGGAGVVGGYAFIDNNRDGTEQTGEILRQEDVVVRIYESDAAANSTLVSTTTTDAFGNYSFSGLTDGERYRVEFDFPGGGGLDQTVNGSSNRTSVQFITSPTCAAHIGITDSEAFCQDNPQVLVPCYVKGNHLGVGANRSALVGFPYLSNGAPASGPITNYATIGAVGALWGLAHDKNQEVMYSASTMKRHNGLLDRPTAPAEGMLGGIFRTDLTAPPATSTSFLVDLEAIGAELGFIGNDVARGLTLNFGPDTDSTAFAKVGKAGIGDIDVTPDGNFLFYTNLFERKLGRVRMDNDNNPATPYTPANGDLVEFDLPSVSCAGSGTLRPWALKVYQGKVYVGAVCDGMGGSKGDLEAFVFTFDLTSGVFDATPVFDFPLTYPKGFLIGQSTSILEDRTGWHPWTDDFSDIRQGLFNTSNWLILYPVPILSDIEFDIDGTLVLGFMDRTSQQIGFLDLAPSGGPTAYNIVAGGDVLRAFFSNGNYVLENNAKAGPSNGYGPNNNQGPGLGEFYNDNYNPTFSHAESFLGGLALRPGSGEVMSTVLDPTPTTNTNGVRRLSNTTGQTTAAFEIVNNVSGTNRKGNSLGDLELACVRFTEDVQIGGYLWGDANPDGVQASVETPIEGVIVQLFDPVTGDLIATTTTDENGEYYFTEGDTNTPGGQPLMLDPNTSYEIVFGDGQYDTNTGLLTVGEAVYMLGTPNVGQGPDFDLNDSDGESLAGSPPGALGSYAGFPSISATSPSAGGVDHSFDVGFLPNCRTLDLSASSSACDSETNSHEVAGQLTFTNAPITGTLTIMIPGFGGGVQTFDPPFNSPLDYTITGVASNGETRTVIATFSEDGGMCADTATYLAPEQCLSCLCHNYIYLNEPNGNKVLKFRVERDSSLTLVGDPFAAGIGSPHGIGIDGNGFIYIGSATTRRIHKYSCDGTFIEIVPGISVLQTNTVVKGNYLYTTVNNSGFVQCFDLCTYERVGYLDFDRIGASWGLAEGEDGNLYVAGGQGGQPIVVYQFPADPSIFKLSNITVYSIPYFANDPMITGTQTGLDVDEYGNVYVASMSNTGIIRKIAQDGTVLATATDNIAGDGGHSRAFGIVYNRETRQVYTTQNHPNEDCIAVLDADDLTYRPDLRVPASPPLVGKGIGILQECCPTLDSIRIDTIVCALNGVSFELNELLPCPGLCAQPTPNGGWTRISGTGGEFNECDLSFTIDEFTTSSCFEFEGGSIDGACFPYQIDICFDIERMTPPVISGDACSDPSGEQILVSTPSDGVADITYQWQSSTSGCSLFQDIPGATELTYTPTAPDQITYYRVKASSPVGLLCEQFSNCLRVELDTMATSTICNGGTNSVTFSARTGLTSVAWFNEADIQVGTGTSLVVSSNTDGLADGAEEFRYTALDANGDPFPSACPFRVVTETCLDYGDLPEGYPTTMANDGPSHVLIEGLFLGNGVQQETDGQPSAMADGDGTDEEDGVTAFPVFEPGLPATITVNVTNTLNDPMNAFLYTFIDWNGDGLFDGPGETIVTPIPAGTNGPVSVMVNVPVGAVSGQDLGVRFRLSTDTNLMATGPASNGEVEDYLVRVEPCSSVIQPQLMVKDSTICSGDVLDISTLVTANEPPGMLSYHATQADATAGANALTNVYVAPGDTTTYYVRSAVSANCFAVEPVTVNALSLPAPVIAFGPGANSSCAGAAINLADLVTDADGGELSFYATRADAEAGMPSISPMVTPATATNYYVRSTVTAGEVSCYGVAEITVVMATADCSTPTVTRN